MSNLKRDFLLWTFSLTVLLVFLLAFFLRPSPGEKTDVVLIGLDKHEDGFIKSLKKEKVFSDLYNAATDNIKMGNYQNAIKLLNESISYAGFRSDRTMAYMELAEI